MQRNLWCKASESDRVKVIGKVLELKEKYNIIIGLIAGKYMYVECSRRKSQEDKYMYVS